MGTKIGKAEFDALPEVLKGKFTATGDEYELHEEDVEGLKRSKAEILAENKKLKEKYGDIDPEAARKALEATAAAEDEKLKAAGEFEKLKEQLLERHKTEIEKVKGEHDRLLANLKREKLTNVLTEKGVLPDRAKYLVHELDSQIELASGADGFSLKKIGGIGDAAEFDAMIENVKASSPFFFAANNASGSGASGSSNNGGGDAKTMARSAFDAMNPAQQMAFSKSGGTLTD